MKVFFNWCATVCVIESCIASSAISADVQELWKRDLPDDVPGRYRRYSDIERGSGPPTLERLERLKRESEFTVVEKIELLNGRDIRVTYAEDLLKLAEFQKWEKDKVSQYVIAADIGEFKYSIARARKERLAGTDVPKAATFVSADYYGRDAEREAVEVEIVICDDSRFTELEFIRRLSREGELIKYGGGYVVRSHNGLGYIWMAGEGIRVRVSASLAKPTKVVETYLKKFPSTLPHNFNLDNATWARSETEWWLAQAKRAVERQDQAKDQHPFAKCLDFLVNAVFVPNLIVYSGKDIASMSLDEKREMLNMVEKWWQQHKEQTSWDPNIQRLVARGQSPIDLEKAARKWQQQDIDAKLKMPLKEQKVLIEELVKVFEADRLEFQRWAGPERAEGFGKVADGLWKMRRRSSSDIPWDTVEIRGPRIEKTENKRYPLAARFTSTFIDGKTGEKRERRDTFTYDKLQDKWFYGTPPKE